MSKELENKFLVINYKRFKEIEELTGNPEMDFQKTNVWIANLLGAIENFQNEYFRVTGKQMNQEYIVCNKDEPYADKVINIILEGE